MFNITITVDLSDRLGQGAFIDVVPIAWLPNDTSEKAMNLLAKVGNTNPQTGEFIGVNPSSSYKAMREISKMCVKSWNLKDSDDNELPIPKLMTQEQLLEIPTYVFNKIMVAAQSDSGEIPEENGEPS